MSNLAQSTFKWGEIQNSMGYLTKDHKALLPEKFMESTNLTATVAAKELETSRPNLYKKEILLKPSTKLKDRVLAVVMVTDVAFQLFDKDPEETAKWLITPNILLFGASPFEVCMRGEAPMLVQWLLDRAGIQAAPLKR